MRTYSEALRKVAKELANKPWTSTIERTLEMVADEFEQVEKNLDPLPFVINRRLATTYGDRADYTFSAFYERKWLTWDPRPGYEQSESEYKYLTERLLRSSL